MKFNQGANSREHKESPENIYITPTIRLFYLVIKNNRKVKKKKKRKATLEVEKPPQISDSELQNMVLISRNTKPGLIIDLKDLEIIEVRPLISFTDTGLQPQHPHRFIPQMKH